MTAPGQFLFEVVGAPESGRCEVVFAAPQCPVRALSLLARLVGDSAVIDADLGKVWGCVVICSPQFSAFHRGQLAPQRPRGSRIFLFNR